MKEFRARQGPFPIRLLYEVSEIDDICADALRNAKLLPAEPSPIKIDLFLERFFQVIVDYADLGEGILGSTIFNSKGAVTGFLISSRLEEEGNDWAERRIRSTLAHEGGHGLLHPRLFMEEATGSLFESASPRKPTTKFLCRSTDIQPAGATVSYNGSWWEWQANRAIGGFLLPKPLVRQALSEKLTSGAFGPVLKSGKRKDSEKHLAEVFEVNPIVARIRLDEMFPPSAQEEL